MASLLITVFILQLVIYLINQAGASRINDILWYIYNRLPTPTSTSAQAQTKARNELVKLQREMNGVSAQDDFARWAKLRRQMDKATADYDKLTASLSSSRSSFDTRINIVRSIAVSGTGMFLQWWYVKSAMFWLPNGWVPNVVEWLLCLPRAPWGSVSIQVWSYACTTVIAMLGEVVMAAFVLVMRQTASRPGVKQDVPVEMKAR